MRWYRWPVKPIPSRWTLAHVAAIAGQTVARAPLIRPAEAEPLLPGVDLWDYWPVQQADGSVALVADGALFMLLSAPSRGDPDNRHAAARIRLMHRGGTSQPGTSWRATGWRDLGPVLPEGFTPGSREWSGSAILEGSRLTLHFTAVGYRGEARPSFAQRIFETAAVLQTDHDIALTGWEPPRESVVADDIHYMRDMAGGGAIGTIKAFRDPAFFRDPVDGRDYLLFTASLADDVSPWNGAVGIARRAGPGWHLLPPLLGAAGVNNELERPHVVVRDGRYHLFWSTQDAVFAPTARGAPTGLYGMVADALFGPWTPINGSGLVFANPVEAPRQAYSWLVLDDLSVLGFADMVGLARPPADPAEARAHFGGVPAPALRLWLDGDRAGLA